MSEDRNGLPTVRIIRMSAPLAWLAEAWTDLWKAPVAFLGYGFLIACISAAILLGLAITGLAFWMLALAAGFIFVAPVIAMGVYEGGRTLETGRRPTLRQVIFVRSALRRDVMMLGVALLLMFGVWLELALITAGLAANRTYASFEAFITFAIGTSAGHSMLLWGGVLGGILAWLTFSLIVVSAPMLLDTRRDIFTATVTSVRSVARNTGPMLLWAGIIAAFILCSIASGCLLLMVVIPWLGLASWRAYRALVAG